MKKADNNVEEQPMVVQGGAIYKDVIKDDEGELAKVVMEDTIHEILKQDQIIGKAKG